LGYDIRNGDPLPRPIIGAKCFSEPHSESAPIGELIAAFGFRVYAMTGRQHELRGDQRSAAATGYRLDQRDPRVCVSRRWGSIDDPKGVSRGHHKPTRCHYYEGKCNNQNWAKTPSAKHSLDRL
jgi:hypothetical protein